MKSKTNAEEILRSDSDNYLSDESDGYSMDESEAVEDSEFDALLDQFRTLCARKECCTYDIERRLAKLSKSEMSEAIISSLKADGFLSDSRYAAAYAHDKSKFFGWGAVKIRYSLLAKKIDEDSIAEALKRVDKNVAFRRLETAMEKKLASLTDKDSVHGSKSKLETYQRLLQFGYAKGFPIDIVEPLVKRLMERKKH